VALVLVGIWVLTQALFALGFPLDLLINGDSSMRRLIAVPVALLPALGAAALGLWLIARRRELAARWFRDDGPEVRLDGLSLLHAGILIVAVATLVGGVVTLVSDGVRFIFYAAGVPSGAGRCASSRRSFPPGPAALSSGSSSSPSRPRSVAASGAIAADRPHQLAPSQRTARRAARPTTPPITSRTGRSRRLVKRVVSHLTLLEPNMRTEQNASSSAAGRQPSRVCSCARR
jgi:hypothetical protein